MCEHDKCDICGKPTDKQDGTGLMGNGIIPPTTEPDTEETITIKTFKDND